MQSKHLFLTLAILLILSLPSLAKEPIILNHAVSVHTVAFSPVDASLVASAGENRTIKLWNLENDTVTTLRGHTDAVNAVAFSPNGKLLVSGGDDWTFRLWDISQGQNIATLEHITDRTRSQVKDVAFSPDGGSSPPPVDMQSYGRSVAKPR